MNTVSDSESIKIFPVPDLGEGLEEVTIVSWNVAPNETIDLNQTLCVVETAKAQVEIPSPYQGTILELGGGCGDILPVGTPLVSIDIDSASSASTLNSPPVSMTPAGPCTTSHEPDIYHQSPRRKASPAARKLARHLGVDLNSLSGDPTHVISVEDVRRAGSEASHDFEVASFNAVEAAMAERMSLSRQNIPDAHTSVYVDASALLQLRHQLIEQGISSHSVTPFILLMRLVVLALGKHPRLNSVWAKTEHGMQLHTYRRIHVGFGVATSRGLVVPVIHDAHLKNTQQLSQCVGELITSARQGTLQPAQLQGSTFTLSNFGALGLDEGVPIINYPEVAILGISSIRPCPTVIDEQIRIRQQMTLTCTFDHRIADGYQIAQFLGQLRSWVEHPHTALWEL